MAVTCTQTYSSYRDGYFSAAVTPTPTLRTMAPMERPASAAMGQAVAAREASEGELLTQARSLSYRLRLVRDSLERLRPSSELLIGKRCEAYVSRHRRCESVILQA